jgi:hypothetical protein
VPPRSRAARGDRSLVSLPELSDTGSFETCRARFGSLDIRLHAGHRRYVDILPHAFRLWPVADDATAPGVELVAVDGTEPRPPAGQAGDFLRIETEAGTVRVSTAISELRLDRMTTPACARLVVHVDDQQDAFVDHYIVMHLQKLLQQMGRLRLHGAAVELGGRTAVFLGDKGAGKSTISLALGRAGATVLADDQIVIRRTDGEVLVSGVDGALRVTEKTERYFFDAPIRVPSADFGGVAKKEVALADHVAASPGVDVVPSDLLFCHVGDHFEIRPLARSEAVRRVVHSVQSLHRFAGPDDQADFLGLVTTFVQSVDVFELELSPDLAELDRLIGHLGRDA